MTPTSETHMRGRQQEGLLMICGGCVSQLPGKHALTAITKKSYEAHGVLWRVTTGREAVKHGTNTAKASCRWSPTRRTRVIDDVHLTPSLPPSLPTPQAYKPYQAPPPPFRTHGPRRLLAPVPLPAPSPDRFSRALFLLSFSCPRPQHEAS